MSRAIYVLTQENLIDIFDQAQRFHEEYERRNYSANCSQCEGGRNRHDNLNRVAPFGRDELGCALTREAWKLKSVQWILARYEFVTPMLGSNP